MSATMVSHSVCPPVATLPPLLSIHDITDGRTLATTREMKHARATWEGSLSRGDVVLVLGPGGRPIPLDEFADPASECTEEDLATYRAWRADAEAAHQRLTEAAEDPVFKALAAKMAAHHRPPLRSRCPICWGALPEGAAFCSPLCDFAGWLSEEADAAAGQVDECADDMREQYRGKAEGLRAAADEAARRASKLQGVGHA